MDKTVLKYFYHCSLHKQMSITLHIHKVGKQNYSPFGIHCEPLYRLVVSLDRNNHILSILAKLGDHLAEDCMKCTQWVFTPLPRVYNRERKTSLPIYFENFLLSLSDTSCFLFTALLVKGSILKQ